jgi:hypothetical protein
MLSESSDDEINVKDNSKPYRFNGTYYTKDEYRAITGQTVSSSSKKSSRQSLLRAQKEKFYPNLSVLIRLLPLSAIQAYPKLSFLIFDGISEFTDIFDNQFISFFKMMLQNKIVTLQLNASSTATQSPPDEKEKQVD